MIGLRAGRRRRLARGRRRGARAGLVVNAPNPETIRLLPPLTITADELGEGISPSARRPSTTPPPRLRTGLPVARILQIFRPGPAARSATSACSPPSCRREDTRSRSAGLRHDGHDFGLPFLRGGDPARVRAGRRLGARSARSAPRLSRLPARPDPRSRRPGRGRGPPGTTRTTGYAADPHARIDTRSTTAPGADGPESRLRSARACPDAAREQRPLRLRGRARDRRADRCRGQGARRAQRHRADAGRAPGLQPDLSDFAAGGPLVVAVSELFARKGVEVLMAAMPSDLIRPPGRATDRRRRGAGPAAVESARARSPG